jgi:2-polyprenyl-3-methyl-5-hydroxy-6-metoxy-1,4-benzoquinol methylase
MSLDVLKTSNEIDEGFLICINCKTRFPIIQKIPIIMEDFVSYIGIRRSLGGQLYHLSTTTVMKQFIKNSLSKIKNTHNDDHSLVEERWSEIYTSNRNSSFYSVVKNKISDLPSCNNVLEFGSSIGTLSGFLRKKHRNIFCVDMSFVATLYAKKQSFENLDCFVSDALNHPFGKIKFDLILALNMLEIVEPTEMLETISKQIERGYILLTDPYDYTRGKNSVKFPLYAEDVRKKLRSIGFSITKKTSQPNFINWTLKINPRTKLNYKVDMIIGRKH